MANTPSTATDPDLVVIPVSDFTEAKVDGEGVYDILMKANAAHLEKEFNATRIKGSEYAQIYLGTMQATMGTAVQFFIQRHKLGYEAEILKLQSMIAQVELEKARVELEIAQLNAQKIPAEIAVLQAQKCKLDAEYDVLVGQKLKVVQETALLQQKVATEKAQTVSASVDPDSVIGKQIILYQAQADGFKRDAEQKAAQILIGTWNARRTTDDGTEANSANLLYDPMIGRVVTKLASGIDA